MERWRCLSLTAIGLTLCMLLWGCASPVEGLWPPSPDSPSRTIYVSLDTWHAMIAFPVDTPDASRFTPHAYEEWGYAERAWYVEGRRGVSDVLRALFWPSEGVVEVGWYEKVWADRTPQPPSELFTFQISEEGYRRLRRHLRATMAGSDPILSSDRTQFYPAVRSYHLFHTCHQYAANALSEAGLPVSAFWAFSRTSLAIQLRRIERMAGTHDPEAHQPRPP